jgi:hypothetical protein
VVDRPDIDDLRRRLRELGYLQTRVDRFVLGPAQERRSALRIAAGASLRIGTLAAVLLGPAAAVGIAARVPGLVTGPRDGVILAVYLAALFGAAAAIVSFLAAIAARALLRGSRVQPRLRLAAAIAGGIVTAACLAYLALWWRAVNPGPAWSAPAWTAFALAVALAISLLLGHAVTVAAAGVLARDGANEPVEPARPPGRLRFALRVAAFAGAAALLIAVTSPGADDVSGPAPEFAVVPTGVRVRVLAIDGFDPRFFSSLGGPLRLPALGRLLSGPVAWIDPGADRDPARVWTTIATGMPPERHGVSALELRRVAGLGGTVDARRPSGLVSAMAAATDVLRLTRPALASGDVRREKAVWEVAAEKGLSTAAVNWWATWPAPSPSSSSRSVVLSDRAVVRLDRGGPQDAEIAPPELYETLRGSWQALLARARAIAREAVRDVADPGMRDLLARSAELDAMQILLATQPAIGRPDLLLVYLPGLDIAQHAVGAQGGGASAMAARLDALGRYYTLLDGLASLWAASAGDALLATVTHPGRGGAGVEALFALASGPLRTDVTRVGGRLTDIAPTFLYALGLPVSRAIEGRPLTTMFTPAFVARYPLRDVETYGRRAPAPPRRGGQPLDEEMIERLRSLGYVR